MEEPPGAPLDALLNARLEAWLDRYPAPNTRDAYRRDLTAFLTWCEATGCAPLQVTPQDLHRYRDTCLAAGASSATVARRLSGMASFFRHALGADPVAHVPRPAAHAGLRASLDRAEIAALLQAAQGQGAKPAALLSLLVLDGMRLREALSVEVNDLRAGPAGLAMKVVRRGAPVEVALHHHSAKAVSAYLAGRSQGPLFLSESPTAAGRARLTRFGADFIIKRAAAAAGLGKAVSATVLRRTYLANAKGGEAAA